MKKFLIMVVFAGFFTVAGAALATDGEVISFDDLVAAVSGLQSEIADLKTELTVKAAQDALARQELADAIEELRNRSAAVTAENGIARSEHFILGDASFE